MQVNGTGSEKSLCSWINSKHGTVTLRKKLLWFPTGR